MIYEKDYLKYQKITWQWVRGHEQNKFNERVDELARRACS